MNLLVVSSNSPYLELDYVSAPVGGAEWGLRLLAEHAASDHAVTYLSTAFTGFRPARADVRERIAGVSVVHLTGPSVPGLQRALTRARGRAWDDAIARTARDTGCDVAVTYATVPDTAAAVAAKASVPGMKVVEWMAGRGWELHLRSRAEDLELVRTAFLGKDATLFESSALRDYTDEAEARFGLRRAGRDAFVEFASASPARGARDAGAKREGPPVVLCAAAFKPGSKRQDLLVEAWPRVLETAPDARLVLTGDGSLRAAVAARVAELGITDSVALPGVVSRERLGRYFRDAAVFALPTEFEGRPQALLDALEERVPVVVSDIPAHREILGEDSVLLSECVVPNTPEAFAAALRRILGDEAVRSDVAYRVDALASALGARRKGAMDRIVATLEAL